MTANNKLDHEHCEWNTLLDIWKFARSFHGLDAKCARVVHQCVSHILIKKGTRKWDTKPSQVSDQFLAAFRPTEYIFVLS